MDAKPLSVSDIFSGDKQYVIPVFQRSYSWKIDEWEPLWNDIKEVTEIREGFYSSHFIGPFIVIPKVDPTEDQTQVLVIDGQQRLITLTILLCVLRDRAKALNLNNLADSIEANAIFFKDTGGKNQHKIIPRLRDSEVLLKIIHGNNNNLDSDSLITKAYDFFSDKIIEDTSTTQSSANNELFANEFKETIDSYYQAIRKRLRAVWVTLDSYDNPSAVFESLNFKGERLTDADLIRNYVFMQLPVEKQETFDNNVWKPFETQFENEGILDSKGLTDFYYKFLTTKKGYFPKTTLYANFMSYVDNIQKKSLGDNITRNLSNDLVDDLKTYARYYLRIVYENEKNLELLKSFKRFNKLDVSTAIPLILALYRKFDLNKISLSDFLLIMQLIESFVIRRSIMRMRTRGYGQDFAKAINHSDEENLNFESISKYFLKRGFPDDEEIENALIEFPIYYHESVKTKLILTELEKLHGHKEKIKQENLTIEHVMPQNLTLEWKEMLGENAEEIHDKYVHTIGNLTLTGYNPNLSNLPFDRKREIFSESNLELNKEIAKNNKWTEKEIISRSKDIADKLIKHWLKPPVKNKNKNNEIEVSNSKTLFD